jgi:hypothetical protein
MSALVPNDILMIRCSLCSSCETKCAAYTNESIDHTEQTTVCPDGHWGQYITAGGELLEAPSLAAKISHFTIALLKWQLAGRPWRTKEQVKECLSVCSKCEFYNLKGNFHLGECRHPRCGCTDFKPRWATEDCPADKWPKLPPKDSTESR